MRKITDNRHVVRLRAVWAAHIRGDERHLVEVGGQTTKAKKLGTTPLYAGRAGPPTWTLLRPFLSSHEMFWKLRRGAHGEAGGLVFFFFFLS